MFDAQAIGACRCLTPHVRLRSRGSLLAQPRRSASKVGRSCPRASATAFATSSLTWASVKRSPASARCTTSSRGGLRRRRGRQEVQNLAWHVEQFVGRRPRHAQASLNPSAKSAFIAPVGVLPVKLRQVCGKPKRLSPAPVQSGGGGSTTSRAFAKLPQEPCECARARERFGADRRSLHKAPKSTARLPAAPELRRQTLFAHIDFLFSFECLAPQPSVRWQADRSRAP
jgi:hypothetical protein